MINTNRKKNQRLSALDRFYDLSPHKPYCSDNLSGGLVIRGKKSAFSRKYIQHNPPAIRHWLTFDLDHHNPFIWEDEGLPVPNLTARNPDNGKCHLSYAIHSVCTSEAGRIKPLAYAEAIQCAYTDALKSDRCYSGLITKNPLHDHWHVIEHHQHIYELGELADHVELSRQYWTRKRASNDEQFALGRNCAMFHRLRYWAYDWVNDFRDNGSTYNQWMAEVLTKAESFNTFPEPLPYSEIKATAKSVGKWVWTKYTGTGSGVKRGAMVDVFKGSQIEFDLTTKQRLSARNTHQKRRAATEEKIIQSVGLLTSKGKRVTVAAIARNAGVSRQLLYKDYKHLIK